MYSGGVPAPLGHSAGYHFQSCDPAQQDEPRFSSPYSLNPYSLLLPALLATPAHALRHPRPVLPVRWSLFPVPCLFRLSTNTQSTTPALQCTPRCWCCRADRATQSGAHTSPASPPPPSLRPAL